VLEHLIREGQEALESEPIGPKLPDLEAPCQKGVEGERQFVHRVQQNISAFLDQSAKFNLSQFNE
jgi:hypothetical protein